MEDLLALRDIGIGHAGELGHAMSVSPDGRQITFVMSRGDPKSNSYCRLLMVVPAGGKGQARALDNVGQPDLSRATIRGLYNPNGVASQNVPLWSPDGARIAYQKRAGTRGEAWVVEVMTGKRERLSPGDVDVERIAWLDDGRALAFAYRTGREREEAALQKEGRTGYLFDDRFATYTGNQPLRRANLPLEFRAVEISTGRLHEISDGERAFVIEPNGFDPRVLLSSKSRSGRQAWTELEKPAEALSTVKIWATDDAHNKIRCEEAPCVGNAVNAFFTALWWSNDGKAIYWLRREGWSNSNLALYRWRPGTPVQKVLQTEDMLLDCQQSRSGVYCLHESSTTPRHIIRLDETGGRWGNIFEPNPEWTGVHLGSIQRLHWRNQYGFEVFGDLVLPPAYKPGTRIPLIVTQYVSRGFLRGAIGDEVPIFPFAARGYAVLSYNSPKFFFMGSPHGNWKSFAEAERSTTKDWSERRSNLSAVMAGIDLVIEKGVAAPGAVGITGVSDGGSTTQFAIVAHPDRFAAASVSACCMEPKIMMVYGGTALADERRAWGFPEALGDDLALWKPISPSLNAKDIKTPLLISNGDNETIVGIETFTALRDAGKAVEMYIYPGDYHIKYQPAHREAVYRRNIAWFDFWLRHREDPCMASEAEFARWRKLPGAPAADLIVKSSSCSP